MTIFLAACAPQVQEFIATPAGQPTLEKGMFIAADGAVLPYRSWLPEKKPKAAIVALHGFNDYSNAFKEAGEFMSRHGIALYAYDQRGFGASPWPGIWGGQENLMRDLRQFTQQVAQRHPETPLYLMGESMGGAVAIVTLASWIQDPGSRIPEIAGLILVAPAVWGGETMNLLMRSTLWAMAHIAPSAEFTGSDLKVLASDNIPMLRALGADPLVIKASRADAIYGLAQLMDDAHESMPRVKTPMLLLYGACDQVIPPLPVRRSLDRVQAPLTFAYYPEGYHMLLRDTQGPRVLGDMLSWLRAPILPLPSGLARDSWNPLDAHRCLTLKN